MTKTPPVRSVAPPPPCQVAVSRVNGSRGPGRQLLLSGPVTRWHLIVACIVSVETAPQSTPASGIDNLQRKEINASFLYKYIQGVVEITEHFTVSACLYQQCCGQQPI